MCAPSLIILFFSSFGVPKWCCVVCDRAFFLWWQHWALLRIVNKCVSVEEINRRWVFTDRRTPKAKES